MATTPSQETLGLWLTAPHELLPLPLPSGNTTSTGTDYVGLDLAEKRILQDIRQPDMLFGGLTNIPTNVPNNNNKKREEKGKKKSLESPQQEPMLKTNPDRFVIHPAIENSKTWGYYKQAVEHFWTAEDIDFSEDADSFKKLDDAQQNLAIMVIAHQLFNDAHLNGDLVLRLLFEVQRPEARCLYGMQVVKENIHSESLSLAFDILVKEKTSDYVKERNKEVVSECWEIAENNLIRANYLAQTLNLTGTLRRQQWNEQWHDKKTSHGERLIGLTANKAIFHLGPQLVIQLFAERKWLPGLVDLNK
jgi:hypothetical protein